MPERPRQLYVAFKNKINGDKYLGKTGQVKYIDSVKYQRVTRFGSRTGPIWLKSDILVKLSDNELLQLIEGEIERTRNGGGAFELP